MAASFSRLAAFVPLWLSTYQQIKLSLFFINVKTFPVTLQNIMLTIHPHNPIPVHTHPHIESDTYKVALIQFTVIEFMSNAAQRFTINGS